jgi:hypothetical protein
LAQSLINRDQGSRRNAIEQFGLEFNKRARDTPAVEYRDAVEHNLRYAAAIGNDAHTSSPRAHPSDRSQLLPALNPNEQRGKF